MTSGAGSSFPLTRLAAKMNEMKKDGRVLSNRDSIEIISMRMSQLAERVDHNDAPDRLDKIFKMWTELRELELNNKLAEAIMVKQKIDAEFNKAREDYKIWEQMMHATDIRRKLVESEVKILREIQAIMTAEDAYNMVAELLAAVIESVNDPNTLKRIQHAFTRIIGDTPIGREDEIDSAFIEDADAEE